MAMQLAAATLQALPHRVVHRAAPLARHEPRGLLHHGGVDQKREMLRVVREPVKPGQHQSILAFFRLRRNGMPTITLSSAGPPADSHAHLVFGGGMVPSTAPSTRLPKHARAPEQSSGVAVMPSCETRQHHTEPIWL